MSLVFFGMFYHLSGENYPVSLKGNFSPFCVCHVKKTTHLQLQFVEGKEKAFMHSREIFSVLLEWLVTINKQQLYFLLNIFKNIYF